MLYALGPHMLWFEVDIDWPGVHLGVHPLVCVMVFHLLLCLLFFTGPFYPIFIQACLPNAQKTQVTHAADPQPLSCVNMSNYCSFLGAWAADHKATFPAVVSALGHSELVVTAHADGSRLVGDPGDSESRTRSAVATLQQPEPTVLHMLDPGSLLLIRGSCHVEGLAWCTDQPLVLHFHTIFQVFQLNVLWNDENKFMLI